MEKEIIIPQGNTPEDIKTRKKIISDFYAKWIAAHPDKKIWNKSLQAYIHVKYLSINETKGHAAVSFESTKAVFNMTAILKNAIIVKTNDAKTNDKNQKAFDQMIIMSYKGIRLLVGHQTSKDEYVLYCITAKKSQPGTLTLGLESSYLERVVIPSSRIPCDDSNAKVMLFSESANKKCFYISSTPSSLKH